MGSLRLDLHRIIGTEMFPCFRKFIKGEAMNRSEEKIDACKKMFNSFYRGNEIEFAYNSKKYFLLPYWHKNVVIGALFGEQMMNKETICLSWDELYNLDVQGSKFGDIINLIEILWTNFEI